MSTAALILGLVLGDHTAADIVLILFLPAAGLESILGYCLDCRAFALLMRAGLVPEGDLRGMRRHFPRLASCPRLPPRD